MPKTKTAAFKKGDAVRVLCGAWGAGNRGVVEGPSEDHKGRACLDVRMHGEGKDAEPKRFAVEQVTAAAE